MMRNVAISAGKIVLYFGLLVVLAIGLTDYALPFVEAHAGGTDALPKMLVRGVATFVAMSLPAVALMALFDGKSMSAMGFSTDRAVGDFLTGGAVGGFIFFTAFVAAVFGGWASVNPDFSQLSVGAMAVSMGGMALNSAAEEVMMRGFVLQELMSKFSTTASVIVSSLLFAALHGGQLLTSDMAAIGALNIFLASVLLSLAYLATRSLWLPMGIHAGWNIMQGPVLGIDVSGTDVSTVWHPVVLSGPEMMTGGKFGLEASLLGLIGPTLGIVMMVAMRRRTQ